MFGTYRTFLALMVVALHLGGLPKIGVYAVFGFYCLSGYLMTLIMLTNYGYTASGMTKYAINRFLRIYPVYWVSILMSAALIWYLGNSFTASYQPSMYLPGNFLELFKNLIIFFPFIESPRLTPPAWALTVEVFFYILIGIGVSKSKRSTLIWVGLSLLYHAGALIFQIGWNHRYFTIFAASLPFSTGALIFHYRHECSQTINRLKGRAYNYLPYFLVSAILVNWKLGHVLNQATGIFFYSNYILCALMVVVLSDRKSLPYISKKFDKWMGDFSYPIYLIHYQVGLIVVVLFAASGIELKRPDLILMAVSIPVIFVISWIITVTVEKPIELIRSNIKK